MSAQIVRFLLGGGTATLVHWVTMVALIMSGTQASVATTVGAFIGALVNYGLQYHVTFSSMARHRDTLPGFLVVSALSLGVNSIVFYALHVFVQWPALISQTVTSGLVAFSNFLLFKRLVFHDRRQSLR